MDERSLELRLPGSVPPVKVVVAEASIPFSVDIDQTHEAAWAYDGDTATTIIRIPKFSAKQGLKCQITPETGISRKQLNGLPGFNRRLVEVARRVAKVSHYRAFFKEERLAIHIAQTGKRISREPQTMTSELRQQVRELARLPDSLAAYARAFPKIIKARPCQQAESLKATRKLLLQVLKEFDRS